jgi:hypothetical protein
MFGICFEALLTRDPVVDPSLNPDIQLAHSGQSSSCRLHTTHISKIGRIDPESLQMLIPAELGAITRADLSLLPFSTGAEGADDAMISAVLVVSKFVVPK